MRCCSEVRLMILQTVTVPELITSCGLKDDIATELYHSLPFCGATATKPGCKRSLRRHAVTIHLSVTFVYCIKTSKYILVKLF